MSRYRIRNRRNIISGDKILYDIRQGAVLPSDLSGHVTELWEKKKKKAAGKAFVKSLFLVIENEHQDKLYHEIMEHPECFGEGHRLPCWSDNLKKNLLWNTIKRKRNLLKPLTYSKRQVAPDWLRGSLSFFSFSREKESMSRDYLDFGLSFIRRGILTAKEIQVFTSRVEDSNQVHHLSLVYRSVWTLLLRLYTPPVDISKWQVETERLLFNS